VATTTLIRGGLVVDGTGRDPRQADIAVVGERIVTVGAAADGSAGRDADVIIDADGQLVCPGFVDAHGHSDLALLSSPSGTSKLLQGVTTEVAGNCGLGPGPATAATPIDALRAAMAFIDVDPQVDWDWADMAGYRHRLRRARPAINVANLAAHLPIHVAACGFSGGDPSPVQLRLMQELLGLALRQGALGLSTGLAYPPLDQVGEQEFVALGRVVKSAGGVFSWHVRDYGDELEESVAQAVRIGQLAGCRIQISHLAAVGRRNWGKVAAVLRMLESAVADGADVQVDAYPYMAGSTVLSQLVPGWAHEGGPSALVSRLAEPSMRSRLAAEMATTMSLEWSEITIVQTARPGDPAAGHTVDALARQAGKAPTDVAFDLIATHHNRVNIVAAGRSEADVRTVLTHPLALMGSDGIAVDPDGPSGATLLHPRSYGAFPRLVGDWVAEGKLSLPAAVAACTSRPAARFGLTGRGVLAPGAFADIAVIDHSRFRDQATYLVPQKSPPGLTAVLVNGQQTVRDGRLTGARAGAVL
jgi:N-acyl-D-aspartate/D-glutamate deacylase